MYLFIRINTSQYEKGIVEEEADETRFWFEIVKEMKILRLPSIDLKLQESDEIISMVVSSMKTMRKAI